MGQEEWISGEWLSLVPSESECISGTSRKDAVLRLGCMVDADSVFVNGTFVGNTFYQYPPRIYRVPASLLKPGENLVTVRLINYGGAASFVPDKPYCLVWRTDTVHLSSRWKYQLGCEMPARTNSVSFRIFLPVCITP